MILKYVVDAMAKCWAMRWRQNGWKGNKKEKAINPDLWAKLISLSEIHSVDFVWVKGHEGIPENERCDELALGAASGQNLKTDSGYVPAHQESD